MKYAAASLTRVPITRMNTAATEGTGKEGKRMLNERTEADGALVQVQGGVRVVDLVAVVAAAAIGLSPSVRLVVTLEAALPTNGGNYQNFCLISVLCFSILFFIGIFNSPANTCFSLMLSCYLLYIMCSFASYLPTLRL